MVLMFGLFVIFLMFIKLGVLVNIVVNLFVFGGMGKFWQRFSSIVVGCWVFSLVRILVSS